MTKTPSPKNPPSSSLCLCGSVAKKAAKIALAAIILSASSLFAAAPAPATPRPAPTPSTRPAAAKTMKFAFTNAPLSAILDEMNKRFDLIIAVPNTAVPGSLTIRTPDELHQEEAIQLLNSLLTPLGYTALESPISDSDKKFLRILPVTDTQTVKIPVYLGEDSDTIAQNDQRITQIIPLANITFARVRAENPQLSREDPRSSDVIGSTAIVITDTSAKIKRLVEIIAKLDSVEFHEPAIRTLQLKYTKAADVARQVNEHYLNLKPSTPITATPNPANPAATPPASQPASTPDIYVDSDARTNRVVFAGSLNQVDKALQYAKSLDVPPATEPSASTTTRPQP